MRLYVLSKINMAMALVPEAYCKNTTLTLVLLHLSKTTPSNYFQILSILNSNYNK